MIELVQIPVWADNYVYLLAHHGEALVVDPSEAPPVLQELEKRGWTLRAILNTHHHPDHVGGNQALHAATGCEIWGPAHDAARIPHISQLAKPGTTCEVVGLSFRVLDVRAHTLGHICFALDEPTDQVTRHGHGGTPTVMERLQQRPVLFVGDSLFLGGCGRLFEGTPEQLHASLSVYLKESPDALVCCAHEYTLSNLRFAKHIFPHERAIEDRLDQLKTEMGEALSSVPDLLGREFQTNPFLLALDADRYGQLGERLGQELQEPSGVIGALRAAKDAF